MCEGECLLILVITFAIFPIPLLCAGIPMWVIGGNSNSNRLWNIFISIPLLPDGPIPSDSYYIASNVTGNYTDTANFTINIGSFSLKGKSVYILHNMWGYNLTAKMAVDGTIKMSNSIKKNFDFDNDNENGFSVVARSPIGDNKDLSSSLKEIQIAKDVFNVACPHPTIITETNRIEPYCSARNGFPMLLEGNYSTDLMLPPFTRDNYYGLISINFEQSSFIPYDYVDIPEAYIMIYNKNQRKSLYIAGVVVTSIGLVFTVLFLFSLIILCLT